MLHLCRPGFEAFLAKELNAPASGKGPGWVRTEERPVPELCFAQYSMSGETELAGISGRSLAKALAGFFLESSRGEAYDGPWPLVIEGGGDEDGSARRAKAVQEFFLEDMLADPDRVLGLLDRWLAGPFCRRFIVNLKFGRLDPLPLLRRARGLEARCGLLRARHLFHDREELTLVGLARGFHSHGGHR